MTDSNLAVPQSNAAARPADLFSDTRIEMIRNTVAKDAPADIFMAMIEIARTRGLDPLAKQISAIKFGGVWQVVTTIDGYRALAEQTGRYAGSDEAIFTFSGAKLSNGKAHPDTASVTVWKLVEGTRYPFTATVAFDEYNGGRNNWLTMPRTMLAKVAEGHALRKAFPTVLSGIYTPEGMDQATVEITGRVQSSTAPQSRPQPANRPASPDEREAVIRTLLERAKRVGWSDRVLGRWAQDKGFASLGAAPITSLRTLSNWFETHPEQARAVAQRTVSPTHEVIDAEIREVDGSAVNVATGVIVDDEPDEDEAAAMAFDLAMAQAERAEVAASDPDRFTR